MALGAREARVTRMVLKQGLSMAIVGLAIGTVLVLPLTMIASVVPARRAARVDPDPVDALRAE